MTRLDPDPDPEFLARLEWQVETALRRRERFAGPTRAPLLRVARTAALCAACLIGGAGAVVAAERLQDERDRALHLERARIEVELAELRLERAQDALRETAELAGAEMVNQASLRLAEVRAHGFERATQRARLDLAETEASGLPANDDLAAPLVAGRDFVGARLELELETAREELERREVARACSESLAEAGLIGSTELDAERAAAAGAGNEVRVLGQLLDVRARFLRGELDARETLVQERLVRIGAEIGAREAELRGLDSRLERSRQLLQAGYVREGEVREEELQRELAARELELLRQEQAQWMARSSR